LRWICGIAWWRGPNRRKGRMDRHSHLGIKLGIKYCARSAPGVVLGQGTNTNPGCMSSSPLVVSSSPSRGFLDPSTSISTGNLVSCLVSCGGFRSWCK
jgi:hypothetical protein